MRTITSTFLSVAILTIGVLAVNAQTSRPGTSIYTQYGEPPVMDNTIFHHLLFNQLEGRTDGPDNEFRWDGEGWAGTDMNKLWFKSEGFAEHGKMTDGDQEALYDHPLPHTRYFDFQGGVRYDLDSDPGRTWARSGSKDWRPTSSNSLPPSTSATEGFWPAGLKVRTTC